MPDFQPDALPYLRALAALLGQPADGARPLSGLAEDLHRVLIGLSPAPDVLVRELGTYLKIDQSGQGEGPALEVCPMAGCGHRRTLGP